AAGAVRGVRQRAGAGRDGAAGVGPAARRRRFEPRLRRRRGRRGRGRGRGRRRVAGRDVRAASASVVFARGRAVGGRVRGGDGVRRARGGLGGRPAAVVRGDHGCGGLRRGDDGRRPAGRGATGVGRGGRRGAVHGVG